MYDVYHEARGIVVIEKTAEMTENLGFGRLVHHRSPPLSEPKNV